MLQLDAEYKEHSSIFFLFTKPLYNISGKNNIIFTFDEQNGGFIMKKIVLGIAFLMMLTMAVEIVHAGVQLQSGQTYHITVVGPGDRTRVKGTQSGSVGHHFSDDSGASYYKWQNWEVSHDIIASGSSISSHSGSQDVHYLGWLGGIGGPQVNTHGFAIEFVAPGNVDLESISWTMGGDADGGSGTGIATVTLLEGLVNGGGSQLAQLTLGYSAGQTQQANFGQINGGSEVPEFSNVGIILAIVIIAAGGLLVVRRK